MVDQQNDARSKCAERLRAKRLEEAAKRALVEAEARRTMAGQPALEPELGGRKGPEPTRYGDWERKGVISDF